MVHEPNNWVLCFVRVFFQRRAFPELDGMDGKVGQ